MNKIIFELSIILAISILCSTFSVGISKAATIFSLKFNKRIISIWLNEISSDIFRGGIIQSCIFFIFSAIKIFSGFDVVEKMLLSGFCFIFATVIVSLISVIYDDFKGSVEKSKSMSEKDKQITLTLIPITASIFRYLDIGFWGIALLKIWGVDILPILSGGALILALLGFAGQSVLQDVFGFLGLIIERPYYVGSTIEFIFDNNCELGIVEQITLRNTSIRNYSGYIFYIPNRDVKNFRVHKK